MLQAHYLLRQCSGMRQLSVVSLECGERRPVGRSFFRLLALCQCQFLGLRELDLSHTMFTLHNLEETAAVAPLISSLTLLDALVFISRRQTLASENDAVLRQKLIGHSNKFRLRLNQGVKVLSLLFLRSLLALHTLTLQVFLVGVSEHFHSLRQVRVGSTEFQVTIASYGRAFRTTMSLYLQSTGCIVYSYGKEEKEKVYRFGLNHQNPLWLSIAQLCEL